MKEGVIKFQISKYVKTEGFDGGMIKDINELRDVLYKFKLIGLNKDTGIGYGNISKRLNKQDFLITGTQTNGLQCLDGSHYALVNKVDFNKNTVECSGPVKPSSESISHAVFYYFNENIKYVLHIHNLIIWKKLFREDMLSTPENAEFGSAELSEALINIVRDSSFSSNSVILMKGHEEGIIICAKDGKSALEMVFDIYKKLMT